MSLTTSVDSPVKDILRSITRQGFLRTVAPLFVISLSHLIFYLFQMTAFLSDIKHLPRYFLSFVWKLTFYRVYLIIKSFPLESDSDKKKRRAERGGGRGEKQAHNSIKYLFDSNVFIDEERLGMLFHIPRSLPTCREENTTIAWCKHISSFACFSISVWIINEWNFICNIFILPLCTFLSSRSGGGGSDHERVSASFFSFEGMSWQ